MSCLINRHGRVDPVLVNLARMTGINVSEDVDVVEMNVLLQQQWVQHGKLRHQMEGNPPSDDYIAILKQLDCINEIVAPSHANTFYDGALVMGTILERVRIRLDYLAREYNYGTYFKNVYLLGSQRPLYCDRECADDMLNPKQGLRLRRDWVPTDEIPTNEIEMMDFVVKQSKVPEGWKITVVDTPHVEKKDGGFRPANTGETFKEWQWLTDFVQGDFLIASNQPFVHYQEANARRILPSEMHLTGIGPAADLSLPLNVFLDNLAKQFYEEFHLLEESGK